MRRHKIHFFEKIYLFEGKIEIKYSMDLWYCLVHFLLQFKRRVLKKMKPDYVFICLDSCRYDTFKEANAPNMKNLGTLRQASSFACFTPATILGYLMNFPPIGLNMGRLYPYKKWSWLPDELQKDGYSTAFLTANAVIALMDITLKGIFKKSFSYHEVIKYEGKTSVESIVTDSIRFLNNNDLTFLFLLLMETHTPMYNGKKAKIPFPIQRPSSVFTFQKEAVEYIDKKLKPLFETLAKRENPVEITITSDHGELLGPIKWGHNPGDLTIFKHSMIEFSDSLFEIPFIRGNLKKI